MPTMHPFQNRIEKAETEVCPDTNGQEPRQGLTQLPRKGAEAWPARCGGDVRSPRKPAGPAFRHLRSSAESPAAAPNQKTHLNFSKN